MICRHWVGRGRFPHNRRRQPCRCQRRGAAGPSLRAWVRGTRTKGAATSLRPPSPEEERRGRQQHQQQQGPRAAPAPHSAAPALLTGRAAPGRGRTRGVGRREAFPTGMLGGAAVRGRAGCRHVGAALPAVRPALRVAAAAALPALAVRALPAAARAAGGAAERRPPRPVPGVRRRAVAAGRRRGAAPPRLPGPEPRPGRRRVRPLRRRGGGRAVPDLRPPPLPLLLPGAQVSGGGPGTPRHRGWGRAQRAGTRSGRAGARIGVSPGFYPPLTTPGQRMSAGMLCTRVGTSKLLA